MVEVRRGLKKTGGLSAPMYTPQFTTGKNHVPILSKDAINDIGEKVAEDFCPNALRVPTEIDADRFLTRYLGLV